MPLRPQARHYLHKFGNIEACTIAPPLCLLLYAFCVRITQEIFPVLILVTSAVRWCVIIELLFLELSFWE